MATVIAPSVPIAVPTGDTSPADGLECCNRMNSGWGVTSLVALGHPVGPIPGISFL